MELLNTFNFRFWIPWEGEPDGLCEASFAECSGLDATVAVKTIREGGNNSGPVHLSGPVSYGNLTLKRGMTHNFGLWSWFDQVLLDGERGLRKDCYVDMLRADRTGPAVTFKLTRCLPVKIKAPALNAKDGAIAIEEMEIAYEMLSGPQLTSGERRA